MQMASYLYSFEDLVHHCTSDWPIAWGMCSWSTCGHPWNKYVSLVVSDVILVVMCYLILLYSRGFSVNSNVCHRHVEAFFSFIPSVHNTFLWNSVLHHLCSMDQEVSPVPADLSFSIHFLTTSSEWTCEIVAGSVHIPFHSTLLEETQILHPEFGPFNKAGLLKISRTNFSAVES